MAAAPGAGLSRRIGEVAEEIGVRPEHQPRIAALQALLVGLHRAVESEEIRIAVIGVGKDAIALAVALAADLLGARIGLGQQHGHVAIGLGADLLALLAALGAEFGRLSLPLSLHALIDRLAVLLGGRSARRMRTSITWTPYGLRLMVDLIAHLRHQFSRRSRTTSVSVA